MTSNPEPIEAFAERVYAAQERGGGRLDIDRDLVDLAGDMGRLPVEVRDANASFVVERLAQAYGGHAVG